MLSSVQRRLILQLLQSIRAWWTRQEVGDAASYRVKPLAAVCLYGVVARSAVHAWPMVEQNILGVLRSQHFETEVYVFNIDMGKELVDDDAIEPADLAFIKAKYFEQAGYAQIDQEVTARCAALPAGHKCAFWYYSLQPGASGALQRQRAANAMRQLYAERAVGRFLIRHAYKRYAVVVALSSDVYLALPLSMESVRAAQTATDAIWLTSINDAGNRSKPDGTRGFTDGFYLGHPRPMSQVLTRMDSHELWTLPAAYDFEQQLRRSFVQQGLRRELTPMVFFKVRANGNVAWGGNTRSMGAVQHPADKERVLAEFHKLTDEARNRSLVSQRRGRLRDDLGGGAHQLTFAWRKNQSGVHQHAWRPQRSSPVEVNCEALPHVDISPVRSPIVVHQFLADRFVGREVVELGTRNGDGMLCFAQVARRARAVEYSPQYCEKLRARAAAMLAIGGHGFEVACEDYRTASLDGDAITWWQQRPLTDIEALAHLRREMERGRLRRHAEAVVLFDQSWWEDVRNQAKLRPLFAWNESIEFDEYERCRVVQRSASPDAEAEDCVRSRGIFVVAGIPVGRVPLKGASTRARA